MFDEIGSLEFIPSTFSRSGKQDTVIERCCFFILRDSHRTREDKLLIHAELNIILSTSLHSALRRIKNQHVGRIVWRRLNQDTLLERYTQRLNQRIDISLMCHIAHDESVSTFSDEFVKAFCCHFVIILTRVGKNNNVYVFRNIILFQVHGNNLITLIYQRMTESKIDGECTKFAVTAFVDITFAMSGKESHFRSFHYHLFQSSGNFSFARTALVVIIHT